MLTFDHLSEWVREYKQSLFTVLICLCLGFVGLMLMMQMTLIEEAHSSSHSSYALSHDIAALRTQWSQLEAREVRKRVKTAEQMLLHDIDHLTMWLQQMGAKADSMGLRSKYRVHSAAELAGDFKGVDVIPVAIDVFPEKSGVLTGVYAQYVQFLQSLAGDQVRVDLQEVQVRGGTGAAHMSVLIHVWVKAAA
ncbi:MAG: hypothetical protein NPIRA05_15760 [Nitrospirales bacterium]|nr:MAG: hypothetical protein NPIRA05_15760 [Nitrospirales bacterium]